MIEVPRPIVKPKEEIWKYCEQLAIEHESTPLEVLKKLVQIGMYVANIEEKGGEVFGIIDGREVEIKVFNGKKVENNH
jgi:hypothetical protein